MNWYKLNSILGLSDENFEKVLEFVNKFSQFKIKLSEEEKELCKSMNIDKHLAVLIKPDMKTKIRKLPQCNEYGEMDLDSTADGICIPYITNKEDRTEDIYRCIYTHKQAYLKKGYNLFCLEANQYQEYYMALVKNKTDIDVLKWRQTNGVNYGIDNHKLIEKILEWKEKYDFVLWGCGRDWLHIFFIHERPHYDGQLGTSNNKFNKKFKLWDKRTPKFQKFVHEVIEFCPDLVSQVYGNKTKLIKEIKRLNGIYLWWD